MAATTRSRRQASLLILRPRTGFGIGLPIPAPSTCRTPRCRRTTNSETIPIGWSAVRRAWSMLLPIARWIQRCLAFSDWRSFCHPLRSIGDGSGKNSSHKCVPDGDPLLCTGGRSGATPLMGCEICPERFFPERRSVPTLPKRSSRMSALRSLSRLIGSGDGQDCLISSMATSGWVAQ